MIRIINGKIITPGGIAEGEVFVKDGIIVDAGSAAAGAAAAPGSRVIDAGGRYVVGAALTAVFAWRYWF